MQTETLQTEIYWCQICQTETTTANPTCPKCGIRMKTQSTVKSVGKVLIFLGIILVLISGLGILVISAVLLFVKIPDNGPAYPFTALLGCLPVLVFGIVAIIRGIRQAKSGRSNKTPMKF